MRKLSDPKNKSLFAIVSIGYNRLDSQSRLLENLVQADFTGYNNVPLVISIDCSGDEGLYNYARTFKWPHGDKYVLIREERMGLKNHILSCGDLTQYFKGVILLEDDLYLNKYFYHYVMQMMGDYGDCDKVACVGMYKNEMNGFCWLPGDALTNGADVRAVQTVCTSGEAFSAKMWQSFKEWYDKTEIDWASLDVPEKEKKWGKAWSKFYDAYLVLNDRYTIYPIISLSTNFGESGEHGLSSEESLRFQATLLYGYRKFQTLPFDELVKYDSHGNSLNLFEVLGTKREETCIDLYGNRENRYGKRYYLSVTPKPYKVLKSFGLWMRPMELNILNGLEGIDIFLYDTTIPAKKPKHGGLTRRVMYYQKGFNSKLLWYLIKGNLGFMYMIAKNRIKRKFKIN